MALLMIVPELPEIDYPMTHIIFQKILEMSEAKDDTHLNHARESVARWLEYLKNIGGIEQKSNTESDWEPLHIGFRGDDE